MHLQVKTKPNKPSMSIHDDDGDDVTVSATYEPGALAEVLTILKDGDFNLRAASGTNVELGGDFSFWVDKRPDDKNHDVSTEAARQLLIDHGYDAVVEPVEAKHLSDSKGTLLDFVLEVTGGKLLVQDINVSTPDRDGIPVQIYTAKVRRHASKG